MLQKVAIKPTMAAAHASTSNALPSLSRSQARRSTKRSG
jgi:hypothetical protein